MREESSQSRSDEEVKADRRDHFQVIPPRLNAVVQLSR